jgi:hypothetical protein
MPVSPFENFVNTELPTRIATSIPLSGNLPAGYVPVSTGVGLGVDFVPANAASGDAQISKVFANADTVAIPAGTPVYFTPLGCKICSAVSVDNETHLHAEIQGVATQDIAIAESGSVLILGIIGLPEMSWDALTGDVDGLIAGKRYYLNPAEKGKITTTPVLLEGDFMVEVGFALSAMEMLFKPNNKVIW